MIILRRTQLVFIGVTYYIPKSLILNEFFWQTEDIVPELPRIHQFLNYWHDNIEAKIRAVEVCTADNRFKKTDFEGYLDGNDCITKSTH